MLELFAKVLKLALVEIWEPEEGEFGDWVSQYIHEAEISFDGQNQAATVVAGGWLQIFDVANLDANYNPFIKERIA